MSKYDHITTAADLIREVRQHGMSTLTEDIVRIQDIIGHSTVGEIEFLAQGGEKDCYGKAKHDYIQNTFFQIIFACWDKDRAVALYNQHVTRYPAQLEEVQGKLRKEMREHSETKGRLELELDMRKDAEAELDAVMDNNAGLLAANAAAEMEIALLKAKLYDLMTAGA